VVDVRGASLVELVIALGVMVGAAAAVSGLSQTVGQLAQNRRASQSANQAGKNLSDNLRYGSLCDSAIIGNVLRNNTATVTTWLPAHTSYDSVSSTPLRLVLQNIGPVKDPLNQDAGEVVIPGNQLRIDKLQFTRPVFMGNSTPPGTAEFLGIVKMRTQSESASGLNIGGGVAARDHVLASVVVKAWNDPGAAVAAGAELGEIIECTGTQTQSPEDFCRELNCTWNAGGTPPCSCDHIGHGCPPGQVLVGVQNWRSQCVPVGGTCGPDAILRGVGVGQAICETLPGCQSQPGALKWASANAVCFSQAGIALIPSGTSINVTSSSANPGSGNGSADFVCKGGVFVLRQGAACAP
jgi:type II secretory pathway pseudopilin PulG